MATVTDVVVRCIASAGGVRIAAGAGIGVDPSSAGVVLAAGLGIGMGMNGSGTAAGGTSNLSRTVFKITII